MCKSHDGWERVEMLRAVLLGAGYTLVEEPEPAGEEFNDDAWQDELVGVA